VRKVYTIFINDGKEFLHNFGKAVLYGIVENTGYFRGFGIPPNKRNLPGKP